MLLIVTFTAAETVVLFAASRATAVTTWSTIRGIARETRRSNTVRWCPPPLWQRRPAGT